MEDQLSIKVVLLGDTGVGKTSLALRFAMNEFRPYSESTIGASFLSKTVQVGRQHDDDGDKTSSVIKSKHLLEEKQTGPATTVSLKIWDTAGQEKYHSLVALYYKGADAAIVVYDICNRGTFQTLQTWVDEISSNGPEGIVLVVCGNKSDLAAHRQVTHEQAEAYANKIGAIHVETSARDDINVHELFASVATRVASTKEPSCRSAAMAEDGINLTLAPASSRSCC